MDDPNDDWTMSGVAAAVRHGAEFRLSSKPTEPDAYASFVTSPLATIDYVDSLPETRLAGGYNPASAEGDFATEALNLAWFDTESSHDGPATVMRLVIDVGDVEGADTSGGFGSVYFSQTGPADESDIKVAELQSATGTRAGGSGFAPLGGTFYVTASSQ
jgi:hypothetical protein